MAGKGNNIPDVRIREDDEWLNIALKTGGCTSIGFDVPNNAELAHRLIKVLQNRFPSS